jgi:hypothetical protein
MLSSRRCLETLERLRPHPWRERRAPSDSLVHSPHDEPVTRGGTTFVRQKERWRSPARRGRTYNDDSGTRGRVGGGAPRSKPFNRCAEPLPNVRSGLPNGLLTRDRR